MSKNLQCLFGLFESGKKNNMILTKRKKGRKRKLPSKMTVMTPSQRMRQNKIKSFSTTILTLAVGNLLLKLSHLSLD